MKILHLTLKKQWFDLIDADIKKEEYREIKPYWQKRLLNNDGTFKPFDVVIFSNGYAKDCPKTSFEINKISIDVGKIEWGAEQSKKYFVISLGKKLEIK